MQVVANALDVIRAAVAAGINRLMRIGTDNADGRILLLEKPAGTGDRATGADSGDEMRDPTTRLPPYLRAGRLPMCLRICRIVVLVGEPRARRFFGEPPGDLADMSWILARHTGGGDNDLGAVGPQQRDLFRARLVRHDNNCVITAL